MRAFLLLVFAVLLACPMAAQEQGGQTTGTNAPDQQADGTTNTETASSAEAADASNRAEMTSGSPWRILLFYDADFTEREGFPEKNFGVPATLASFSGRIAIFRPKFRVFLGTSSLLEHFSQGTRASIGTNGFVGPTFSSTVALSRRWLWDFSLGVGYGADAARSFVTEPEHCESAACPKRVPAAQGYLKMDESFVSPTSITSANSAASAIGDAPALAGPETLVVRSPTQTATTLGAYGSTGLSWQRTNRQQFSLRFSHAESSFLNGNPQGNDIASARMLASGQLTPLSTLITYGQVHHYFQDTGCTFYGGGIGIWHSMSRSTNWELEGGPEFGSRGCGQRLGLNFTGTLRSRISQRMSLAADGGRDLSASYITGSRWADYIEGAAIQQTSARTSVAMSAGYLRTTGEFRPGSTYSGYFVSPQFRWQLNRYWNVLASYRYFQANQKSGVGSGGTAVNWIYLTLQWRPRMLELQTP
jgi:hypothetical protein